MTPILLAATLALCPPAFVKSYEANPAQAIHHLKAKCRLDGATGPHVCIRDKGCLDLGAYDESGRERQ